MKLPNGKDCEVLEQATWGGCGGPMSVVNSIAPEKYVSGKTKEQLSQEVQGEVLEVSPTLLLCTLLPYCKHERGWRKHIIH